MTLPVGNVSKIIGRPYEGTHTLYGNWESDNAVDIAVPVGTPVYAVEAGTIGDRLGPLGSTASNLAGNRVNLRGDSGTSYYYAHLSSYDVLPGQHVKAGDLIGYSGSANGVAHLHFAADNIDPVAFLSGQRAPASSGGAFSPPSSTAAAGGTGLGCLVPAAGVVAGVAALVVLTVPH